MDRPTIIDSARSYIDQGFKVVPLRPRDKKPVPLDWPNVTVNRDNLAQYFPNAGLNIGIITGERSGNLACVDIDCPEALAIAHHFLPPTPMKSGRQGAPRSHWYYRCPGISSENFQDPNNNSMIVQILFTGRQTMVPPSIHPSDEDVVWYSDPGGDV